MLITLRDTYHESPASDETFQLPLTHVLSKKSCSIVCAIGSEKPMGLSEIEAQTQQHHAFHQCFSDLMYSEQIFKEEKK